MLSIIGTAVFAASLLGCGFVQIGKPPPEPIAASSPLGGQPLTGHAQVRDPDLRRARAANCRPWPITDDVAIQVSAAQVCLRQEVHILSHEDGPLPIESYKTELTSDTGGTRTFAITATGEYAKVGGCRGLDDQRTAVWVREYEACIPNDGLIDDRTSSLAIADPGGFLRSRNETIRWKFSARGASTPSSSSPGDAASRPAASRERATEETQEVSGKGFAVRLPAPAEWQVVTDKSLPRGSYMYLGESSATPDVVYVVTAIKLDELDANTRKASAEACLTRQAREIATTMKCVDGELRTDKADARQAENLGFKQAYAFAFKCSASGRIGVGIGAVGKHHWLLQMAVTTGGDRPLGPVKQFLGSLTER